MQTRIITFPAYAITDENIIEVSGESGFQAFYMLPDARPLEEDINSEVARHRARAEQEITALREDGWRVLTTGNAGTVAKAGAHIALAFVVLEKE